MKNVQDLSKTLLIVLCRCAVCLMDYDGVIKQETYDSDVDTVLNFLGLKV